MKLSEALPEFITGRTSIRREIWDKDEYLIYDFAADVPKNSGGNRAIFTINDIMAEDWTFVETLEQKKLERLYEILDAYHDTQGFDARVYKDELLEILRMK